VLKNKLLWKLTALVAWSIESCREKTILRGLDRAKSRKAARRNPAQGRLTTGWQSACPGNGPAEVGNDRKLGFSRLPMRYREYPRRLTWIML